MTSKSPSLGRKASATEASSTPTRPALHLPETSAEASADPELTLGTEIGPLDQVDSEADLLGLRLVDLEVTALARDVPQPTWVQFWASDRVLMLVQRAAKSRPKITAIVFYYCLRKSLL